MTCLTYRPAAVTEPRSSRSAANVALVRSHLTWLGVVDDPFARQMLPPKHRRLAAAMQLPGLRRVGRHSSVPYLAARTLFFDAFVRDALDRGLRQVVVLGAGYDSRAWRLAHPGVTFFEVDQPATQADKRTRAPGGGPVYVPADVTDPRLAEKLTYAGLQAQEPAAFMAEGLAVYLPREAAAVVLATVADLGGAGSRLAVSFESGFERQRVMRLLATRYYRKRGETFRFRLSSSDAPSFLAGTGWTIATLHTPERLGSEHLGTTSMAGRPLKGPSYTVVATRQSDSVDEEGGPWSTP
jgi:methyltransferase (TIGR00027 family)